MAGEESVPEEHNTYKEFDNDNDTAVILLWQTQITILGLVEITRHYIVRLLYR